MEVKNFDTKYDIKDILENIKKDYNDDYLVYFETKNDSGYANDEDYWLTGKTALEAYEDLCNDFKVKYVELQYDPAEDDDLENRIILATCDKKSFDIFEVTVYTK